MNNLCECGCGEILLNPNSKTQTNRGHHNRLLKNRNRLKQTWKNRTKEEILTIVNDRKNTCLERYGVENPNQNKNIREKGKQTCINHFGVSNPSLVNKIKEQKKETSLKNWGVNNPMKSKIVQKIFKELCKEKYGVEYTSQIKESREKSKQTSIKNCGYDHWSKSPDGKKFNRIKSIKETENRKLNGEPLMPCIGSIERECLNELEKIIRIKITRNNHCFAYKIGRFPDGFINELNLVILFDERNEHFLDNDCTIYNNNSIQETKDYKLYGLKLFRISEWNWKNKKQEIISQFQNLITQLSEQNKNNLPKEIACAAR